MVPQLLRVAASIFATVLLLLVAAGVLVACLNLQGLIAPSHSLLFMPRLAALSLPGGLLGQGLLKQASEKANGHCVHVVEVDSGTRLQAAVSHAAPAG